MWRTLNVRVNRPPVLKSPGDKSVVAGSLLHFQVTATDPDSDGITLSMTQAPANASLNGSNFKWTPSSSQVGRHALTFQAMDNGTPPLADSVTITVTVVEKSK
jgi:hypothetical protein